MNKPSYLLSPIKAQRPTLNVHHAKLVLEPHTENANSRAVALAENPVVHEHLERIAVPLGQVQVTLHLPQTAIDHATQCPELLFRT